jgi:hypothetical protein
MRKTIIGLITALSLAVVPSVASGHTLGFRDARRAIGLAVQKSDTGYQRGSLVLYCSRQSAHRIRCDVLFTDDYGDDWCGSGKAILNPYTESIRAYSNTNRSGCEYF